MKIILRLCFAFFVITKSFAQPAFSENVKTFIDYDAPVIAFTNALLIDGRGNPAKENQTVIIRSGKIETIGDNATKIPAGATLIDLKGKALLTGWMLLHEHLDYPACSI